MWRSSRAGSLPSDLLNVGVALVAAMLTVHVVGAVLTEESSLPGKFSYLRDRGDRFDVIFVGTSRTLYQVDPTHFDRRTALLGLPTRSFNFGLVGGKLTEVDYTVRWVLDRESENLEWLVVELNRLNPLTAEKNRNNDRVIRWHSLRRTLLASIGPFGEHIGAIERSQTILDHWRQFGLRALRVGSLARAFESSLSGNATDPFPVHGSEYDGFVSLDASRPLPVKRRNREWQQSFEEIAKNHRRITETKPSESDEPPLSFATRNLVLGIQRACAKRGVGIVFVIPPVFERWDAFTKMGERGEIENLFSFNDPFAHPGLFNPRNRWNVGHLNARGAKIYSRALAEAFVEMRRVRSPSQSS